jgi:sigma-B regulation protein RsbU (phosphoserine phosphatase)
VDDVDSFADILAALRTDPDAGMRRMDAYLRDVLGCVEIRRREAGEADGGHGETLEVALGRGEALSARWGESRPLREEARERARMALEAYALGLELAGTRARETRHLAQIAEIQRALQPPTDLRIPGIEVGISYRPLDEAGGDYYDIVDLSGVRSARGPGGWQPAWGVMIADATGHGPAAAVETAMLDAILRTYRGGMNGGPAHLLGYGNQHLFTRRIRGRFMTAFVVGFDPRMHAILYASAGHNPPLLRRCEPAGVEWLDDAQGIPLGVEPEHRWENALRTVSRGDVLLLYTDGVTEARSPGGEPFGAERLARLTQAADCDPKRLVDSLDAAVEAHRGRAPSRDDCTLIAVRLLPEEAPH